MAKLPKLVLIELHKLDSETIPHLGSIIARLEHKQACLDKGEDDTWPSLPSWYLDHGLQYYNGMLQATYTTIESMLMAYNAYRGFGEIVPPPFLGRDLTYRIRRYALPVIV